MRGRPKSSKNMQKPLIKNGDSRVKPTSSINVPKQKAKVREELKGKRKNNLGTNCSPKQLKQSNISNYDR